MMKAKAMKKTFPEAVRTGEATMLAVGLIAVFAVITGVAMAAVAASGMPFFEIEEVHIEQLPE